MTKLLHRKSCSFLVVDIDLVEFDHGLDPGIPGLPGSWSDQVEKEEIVS